MKIIYQAADITEANIVCGMLQAHGIDAHVGGYYLQGGIGELMPSGFANVQVRDEDIEVADKLIEEYKSET